MAFDDSLASPDSANGDGDGDDSGRPAKRQRTVSNSVQSPSSSPSPPTGVESAIPPHAAGQLVSAGSATTATPDVSLARPHALADSIILIPSDDESNDDDADSYDESFDWPDTPAHTLADGITLISSDDRSNDGADSYAELFDWPDTPAHTPVDNIALISSDDESTDDDSCGMDFDKAATMMSAMKVPYAKPEPKSDSVVSFSNSFDKASWTDSESGFEGDSEDNTDSDEEVGKDVAARLMAAQALLRRPAISYFMTSAAARFKPANKGANKISNSSATTSAAPKRKAQGRPTSDSPANLGSDDDSNSEARKRIKLSAAKLPSGANNSNTLVIISSEDEDENPKDKQHIR
ncbi:hypothetical protein GGI21_005693, partial [Coemansia aciculifera]